MEDTTMQEPVYRVSVKIDPYHVEDGSDGKPLPESREYYEMGPYMKDGAPLPYAEYLRTFGDPERYTGYVVTLQHACPCCRSWADVDSIGTSLYDEPDHEGQYAWDEIPASFRDLVTDMRKEHARCLTNR